MQQHYVLFYSPGTLFTEVNSKEIDSWDVDKAVVLSKDIFQRYGARPFGFQFITKSRSESELDSKETARSNMYYLGGRIETFEDVVKRNNPKEEILRKNMEYNNIKRIIVNDNSYRFTGEFKDDDVLLEYVV